MRSFDKRTLVSVAGLLFFLVLAMGSVDESKNKGATKTVTTISEAERKRRAEEEAEEYVRKIQEDKKRKRDKVVAEHKAEEDRKKYWAIMREVKNIDAYIARFDIGNARLRDPSLYNPDTLEITVTNEWHYQPYQLRLQFAQNLWEGWASVHSKGNPDIARIQIVDFNGNEVGGSRWLAGSLIWVQKE